MGPDQAHISTSYLKGVSFKIYYVFFTLFVLYREKQKQITFSYIVLFPNCITVFLYINLFLNSITVFLYYIISQLYYSIPLLPYFLIVLLYSYIT